jgi:hypothetical protein
MANQRETVSKGAKGNRVDATIRAYRMPPLSAALIDITAGSAMLETDHAALMIGDEVMVSAGSIEAVATVAWSSDALLRVSFHRRLAEWQMAGIRRTGNA